MVIPACFSNSSPDSVSITDADFASTLDANTSQIFFVSVQYSIRVPRYWARREISAASWAWIDTGKTDTAFLRRSRKCEHRLWNAKTEQDMYAAKCNDGRSNGISRSYTYQQEVAKEPAFDSEEPSMWGSRYNIIRQSLMCCEGEVLDVNFSRRDQQGWGREVMNIP